jgi:hypothetical protein
MRFFDFTYYIVYKFYSGKEKGASSSSAGIIGGLQAMNLLSSIMLVSIFIKEKSYLGKLLFLGIIVFFQVTTYIRYIYKENNSIEIIEKRWFELDEITRKNVKRLIFIYIILSISIFFGLAIFLGTRKF